MKNHPNIYNTKRPLFRAQRLDVCQFEKDCSGFWRFLFPLVSEEAYLWIFAVRAEICIHIPLQRQCFILHLVNATVSLQIQCPINLLFTCAQLKQWKAYFQILMERILCSTYKYGLSGGRQGMILCRMDADLDNRADRKCKKMFHL